MMKTSSKVVFTTMMITSTLMVMSCNDWMNLWIGLEINLMSFIPLMFEDKNNYLSQSSMMYFLIQSMASIILIMTIMLNMYLYNYMEMKNTLNMLIMLMLMMKMGMPPFHMWMPEVMMKLKWMMIILMTTWQKIAPMYIMSMIIINNKWTMIVIMMSTLIGSMAGINQTSIRKLMAYSSMSHTGWMMVCAWIHKTMWMMYLMTYSIVMIMTCLTMEKYNIMFINQWNIMSLNMVNKIIIIMMMMSMGGMPPFLGFLPKWMTLEYMIYSNEYTLMLVMLMSSTIMMYYYLRMASSMMMLSMYSQKWMFFIKDEKTLSIMMMFLNMMLPIIISMLYFM